jgi:hypothetical protein
MRLTPVDRHVTLKQGSVLVKLEKDFELILDEIRRHRCIRTVPISHHAPRHEFLLLRLERFGREVPCHFPDFKRRPVVNVVKLFFP